MSAEKKDYEVRSLEERDYGKVLTGPTGKADAVTLAESLRFSGRVGVFRVGADQADRWYERVLAQAGSPNIPDNRSENYEWRSDTFTVEHDDHDETLTVKAARTSKSKWDDDSRGHTGMWTNLSVLADQRAIDALIMALEVAKSKLVVSSS